MKRNELEAFIMETYNVVADYPWRKSPNHEVFRHCSNRKWFALIMDVPKNKLGLQGEELLDVVNLKCDQILIGSLRGEPGFFPAYHMSKADRLFCRSLKAGICEGEHHGYYNVFCKLMG